MAAVSLSILALLSIQLSASSAQKWIKVWGDEFDAQKLDTTKWNYKVGGDGWGNNELEYYTNRTQNVYL